MTRRAALFLVVPFTLLLAGCGGGDVPPLTPPLDSWNGTYEVTWECRGEGKDCPVWPDVGRTELEIGGFGEMDGDPNPEWGWLTLSDSSGSSMYDADSRGSIIQAAKQIVDPMGNEVWVDIALGQIHNRLEGWASISSYYDAPSYYLIATRLQE
jgi:hypothetical protein